MDRIEGRSAVLLADAGEVPPFVLPFVLLPKGTAEGDCLRVSFERDDLRRDRAREEIDRLMDDLGDNP